MAQIVGMSGQGFHNMMEKRTMSVDVLEKIAEHFGVKMNSLFDDVPVEKLQAGYANDIEQRLSRVETELDAIKLLFKVEEMLENLEGQRLPDRKQA